VPAHPNLVRLGFNQEESAVSKVFRVTLKADIGSIQSHVSRCQCQDSDTGSSQANDFPINRVSAMTVDRSCSMYLSTRARLNMRL